MYKSRLGNYHNRFNRLYSRKRFNWWRTCFFLLIIIFFLLVIFYLIFINQYFQVKQIEITGIKLADQTKINQILPINTNIFLYPVYPIRQNILKDNPEISQVRIFRGLPNTIRVEIVEYAPKLIWQRNNQYGLINSNGVLFHRIETPEKYIYLPKVIELLNTDLAIKDKLVTTGFIEFMENVKNNFPSLEGLTFDYIELGSTIFSIKIKTKENIDIIVAVDEDLDQQLKNLKIIWQKKRDIVKKQLDVRISQWAYIQ